MAIVRIRNTNPQGRHVGLSFGFLFGNGFGRKSVLIDESKIKPEDYKLIARMGLTIEAPGSPAPEKPAEPKEEPKPETKIIPAIEKVVAEVKVLLAPEPKVEDKSFSRTSLEGMPYPQLKLLASDLKISKRSRGDIIDAIIKLQEVT